MPPSSLITEADLARRAAVEIAVLRIAQEVGLASASAAGDLAVRLVHEGADPTVAGVVMPSGTSLRDHLADLRGDPEYAHFWRDTDALQPMPSPSPKKPRAPLNAQARRAAATAALDAINIGRAAGQDTK